MGLNLLGKDGLLITEQASPPATPAAGQAVVWVDSDGVAWLSIDAGTPPRPLNGPRVRRLGAASTNATTTPSTINALGVNVDAGEWSWVWEGAYTTAATTYGLRLRPTVTGATVVNHSWAIYTATAASTGGGVTGAQQILGSAATSGGATVLPFRVWGSAVFAAAGSVAFAFAPSAAGSVTIQAGSTVTAVRATL